MISSVLEQTLQRAFALASARTHKYVTLEHLVLALTEDRDAAAVLRACAVDLGKLRADLIESLDKDKAALVSDKPGDPKPTAALQRILQRAVVHVQSSGRDEVTGANLLVALFSERDSHAVHVLQAQDMHRVNAVDFISHGISRAPHPSLSRDTQAEVPPGSAASHAQDAIAPGITPPADVPESSATADARPNPELTTVFISYSHKDRNVVDRLQVHLRPMERDGVIQRWDDRRISPGQGWREEIRDAMERARVAILVISADFLASEFIAQDELPPLLKLASDRGTHILPILASPSRFASTPSLSRFQAFNPPSRPLSAMNRTQRETLLVSVADRVEQLLRPR